MSDCLICGRAFVPLDEEEAGTLCTSCEARANATLDVMYAIGESRRARRNPPVLPEDANPNTTTDADEQT